jgi:hypothetical protein
VPALAEAHVTVRRRDTGRDLRVVEKPDFGPIPGEVPRSPSTRTCRAGAGWNPWTHVWDPT